MFTNRLLLVALRIVSAVIRWVPAGILHAVASLVGSMAYYLFAGPRAGITQNLAVALDVPPGSRRVKTAARGAFRTDALNWVDMLRIGSLQPHELDALIEVRGLEYLEQAVAGGRGAIIVSLHLGNYDLVGQILAARGFALTVPVERVHPEDLYRFLVEKRSSRGIHLIPVERSPREILRALRRGELVGMTGDRGIVGKLADVPLFGRSTALPRGPAALARLSGAPLLLGVGIRLPDGRFRGELEAPIELLQTADAEHDEHENTARIARRLEAYISRYPDQWLAFQPIWPHRHAVDAVATMGQSKEAAV